MRRSFVPGVKAPASVSANPLWFVVHSAGLIVRDVGSSVALPRFDEVVALGLDPGAAHYLGQIGGQDCFTIHAGERGLGEPWSARGLRALYGQLDEETFAVGGRAVQIATFGATHRYCGSCGQPTLRAAAEHCVRCEACALSFYPRIAPAIIVLVRRGDEALLARSARFASGMYSTLAGFVEPGESLEETLAREVREEVGVDVANVRYFGSQPWPFPHSLMVGFNAEYAGGEIEVDGVEIIDARWFSVRELPAIPPKLSIARKLIDAWTDEMAARGQ